MNFRHGPCRHDMITTMGPYSSQWKIAEVTPLHKGVEPENMNNYHSIAILRKPIRTSEFFYFFFLRNPKIEKKKKKKIVSRSLFGIFFFLNIFFYVLQS